LKAEETSNGVDLLMLEQSVVMDE
jgi:hypothetical protein